MLLRLAEKNINSLHRIAIFAQNIQEGHVAFIDNLEYESDELRQNLHILLNGGLVTGLKGMQTTELPSVPENIRLRARELDALCQDHFVSIKNILKYGTPLDSTGWEVVFIAQNEQKNDPKTALLLQKMDSSVTDALMLKKGIETEVFKSKDNITFKLQKSNKRLLRTSLLYHVRHLSERIHNTEQVAEQITNMMHSKLQLHLRLMSWIFGLWVAFSVLTVFSLLWFVRQNILNPLLVIKDTVSVLAKGGAVKSTERLRDDELGALLKTIHELSDYLLNISEFAIRVGQGHFDGEVATRSEYDTLSLALKSMRDNLKRNEDEDQQRNWTTEGMAHFSELLRNNKSDIKAFTQLLLNYLMEYVMANQGAIFVVSDTDPDAVELTAAYAYGKQRFIHRQIKEGEGLVGQVLLERKSILLKKIPQGYTQITSGLGEATPNSLLLVPMISTEKIYGVLEIASFSEFAPYHLQFLEKLCETMAGAIATLKINRRTETLLSESQEIAEQMRAQEEEMMQTIEELASTQESMTRTQEELKTQEKQMKSVLNTVSDFKIAFDTNRKITYANTAMVAYCARMFNTQAIVGESFNGLMPPALEQGVEVLLQACQASKAAHKIVNFKRSDFQDIYFYLLLEPIQDGQDAKFVLSLRDVTWTQPIRFKELELVQ